MRAWARCIRCLKDEDDDDLAVDLTRKAFALRDRASEIETPHVNNLRKVSMIIELYADSITWERLEYKKTLR
jgi:hypothetical protein